MAVSVIAVEGLPEITEGVDLAAMIVEASVEGGEPVADGDVVIVTSKIVSKSEGRTVDLDTVTPSPFARQFAERWEKEPGIVELVLQESKRVVQVGPCSSPRRATASSAPTAASTSPAPARRAAPSSSPSTPTPAPAACARASASSAARSPSSSPIRSAVLGARPRSMSPLASRASTPSSATSASTTPTATSSSSRPSAAPMSWPALASS